MIDGERVVHLMPAYGLGEMAIVHEHRGLLPARYEHPYRLERRGMGLRAVIFAYLSREQLAELGAAIAAELELTR